MGVSRAGSAALSRLRKKIRGLAQTLGPDIVEEIGRGVEDVIASQFNRGVDPDGKPWARPASGNKPLVRTRKLQNSFRLRKVGRMGFAVSSDAVEVRGPVKRPRKSSTVIPRGARKYAIIVQGKRSIVWRRRHHGRLWRAAIRKAIKRVTSRVAP